MNFGNVLNQPCVAVAPAPDTRCDDPAFRLANPDLCPPVPSLIIKPAIALTCQLGSIQFKAFTILNGVETDVTADTVFSSSDSSVVVVGVSSGNAQATGLIVGEATVTATYNDLTADADMHVLANEGACGCVGSQHVAIEILIDITRSMSQTFGAPYSTRLDFAKAVANRVISELNTHKDIDGLMTFDATGDNILSAPTPDVASLQALIPTIAQTQNLTTFNDAVTAAIAELNTTSADIKVLLIISDGEDTSSSYTDATNPILTCTNFKSQGGIVMCVGCRSSGKGYNLLSNLATAGFFVNGYPASAQSTLDMVSGLKGYIGAGNCTPEGDIVVPSPALNFDAFQNWNNTNGTANLFGPGLFDLLPGNGLYVAMDNDFNGAGTGTVLVSKQSFHFEAGKAYRISLSAAGNQRAPGEDDIVVQIGSMLNQQISLLDYTQDFQTYNFSFTAPSTTDATITLSGGSNNITGNWGPLIKSVTLTNVTDLITIFTDDFNSENPQYIPPSCGPGSYSKFLGTVSYGFQAGGSRTGPGFGFLPNSNAGTSVFGPYNSYTALVTTEYTLIGASVVDLGVNFTQIPIVTVQFDYIDENGQPQTVYSNPIPQSGQNSNGPFQTVTIKGGTTIVVTITIGPYSFTGNNWFVQGSVSAQAIPNFPNYGNFYTYGYCCGYGEGCLSSPPPAQLADPNPLPDIESGTPPPTTYSSTQQACASCPTGQSNSPTSLVPVMTSNTAPSGTCLGSGTSGAGTPPLHDFFRAFDGITNDVNNFWAPASGLGWVGYKFPSPQNVSSYSITAATAAIAPQSFTFEGSNDGSSWTVIDTRAGLSWFNLETKQFQLVTPATYTYFRVNVSATSLGDLAIAELDIFGAPVTQVCKTASATSTISQTDADQKASAAALALAQAALQCQTVYTSTEQYTASCAFGLFPVTKSAAASSLNSQAEADAAALAAAQAAATAALNCNQSNNTGNIVIPAAGGNGSGPSNPYPSVKFVSGAPTSISGVHVSLTGLTHTYPADIRALLVAPDGTSVLLMAKVGGSTAISGVNLVFDDSAGSSLGTGTITSGTYKPSQLNAGYLTQSFPAPAPAQPYNAALSALNGKNANGLWALFIWDDSPGNIGNLASGWDLNIS